MTEIRLPGRPYSAEISFPLRNRELLRLSLYDERDKFVQAFSIPVPMKIFTAYGLLIPAAEKFLEDILSQVNKG